MLRVNISVAVQGISDELQYDETQEGALLSSFYWGYCVGQIPGARLANRYGGKLIFGLSICLPSILSIFLPIACRTNFTIALLLRALIGLAQAPCFPTLFQFFSKWVAPRERTIMVTSAISGMYMGEIIGFGLSGILCESSLISAGVEYGSWPSAFYVFGLMGIFWYPFWVYLAYESPDLHPTITKEEIDFIALLTEDELAVQTKNKFTDNGSADLNNPLITEDRNKFRGVGEDFRPSELEYDEYADVDSLHDSIVYRSQSTNHANSSSSSTSAQLLAEKSLFEGESAINPINQDLALNSMLNETAGQKSVPPKRMRRRTPWRVFFSHR